jgi:EmrB/QacA subfamily drug resistance transporter
MPTGSGRANRPAIETDVRPAGPAGSWVESKGDARWWALAGIAICVLTVGLDGTVLTVALPTLAGALHADESDLQWFTSAYLLVLAAAMLPAGRLADRYGHRSVLIPGLVMFAVGSAACALAPAPGWFIAARVPLGIGGAAVIVSALAALTALFDEAERPRAVGVFSAANFLSLPLGPLLGGWILAHAWWGWVFLINVPVAVLGLAAALLWVPSSRPGSQEGGDGPDRRSSLDLTGVVASTTGLVVLTFGLIEAGQRGWTDLLSWGCILVGAATLVWFVRHEIRLRRSGGAPMVDPGLFADRSYTWGVILAAVGVLAMIGMLFTLPQYFQGVLGRSAAGAGVGILPTILGFAVGAIPADRIAAGIGRKAAVTLGFLVLGGALALGSATTPGSSGWFTASWTALAGVGLGLAIATSTSAALSTLTDGEGGIGAAVLQAVNKTGAPFGAAVLGSVLSAVYVARLNASGALTPLPPQAADAVRGGLFGAIHVAAQGGSAELAGVAQQAFTSGMSVALLVSAGVAVAGAALAAVFMPSGRSRGRGDITHDGGDIGTVTHSGLA